MENIRNSDPLIDLFEPEIGLREPLEPPTRQQSRAARVQRRRKRKLRFFSLSLAVVALVLAIVFAVFAVGPMLGFGGAPDYPGPGEGSVDLEVKEGVSKLDLATVLYKEDVVKSPRAFLDALQQRDKQSHQEVIIKPGHYVLKKQMQAAAVVEIFAERSMEKVIYIPVNTGQRLDETLKVLSEATQIDIGILRDLVGSPQEFGIRASDAHNLEGYLAPGDYRFPIGTSAKDIVQQMVTTTLTTLVDAGIRDPDQQYRTLTIASMVQAEGLPQDYAKIAGVIENRLKPDNIETHGFLQIDSTVHYGLGIRDTVQLSAEEKADKSNPYNTYANRGLPLGPISSPGAKAIQAAAHPEPSRYYYWVAVNLDTGETKFSESYAEHEDNVREFDRWCSENKNKCK